MERYFHSGSLNHVPIRSGLHKIAHPTSNVLFHRNASSLYSEKIATKYEPARHCHARQDTDGSRSNNMTKTNSQNFKLLPSFCQLI